MGSIKLSERIYKCPVCGLEIDRDLNAAINLQHYREFHGKLSLWRAVQTGVAQAKQGSMKKEFCRKLKDFYKSERTGELHFNG